MTGVRALERLHPDKPMRAGELLRREFEYKRHGTLALMVHREVASGQLVAPFAAPRRAEADFALSPVGVPLHPQACFLAQSGGGRWGNDPGDVAVDSGAQGAQAGLVAIGRTVA